MTRLLLTHPYPSVLRSAAAARFTPNLRLLVPNVQAGRDLRGALRGAGQAVTLSQLARETLRAAGWTPLSPGGRDAFFRRLLADVPLSYLEPLRFRGGTLRSLQRLMGELMRSQVDPDALLRVAASGREQDVAQTYAALVARCEAAKTYDSAGSEFFAAQLPAPLLLARPTLVYGFAYFDAAQVALLNRLLGPGSLITLPFTAGVRGLQRTQATLEALTSQGFEVTPLDGPARLTGDQVVAAYVGGQTAPQALQKETFPDIESEVRACLGQVRAWVADGTAPERLAVIVRSEQTYLGTLMDVAREYRLPLVSGQQVPLLHTPLGGLVQAWVEAHTTEWRYSAVRRLLSHPLLTLPFDALARGRALQPGCPAGLTAWHPDLTWVEVPQVTTWQKGLGLLQRLLTDWGVLTRCKSDPVLNVALSLLLDRLQAESRWEGTCSREAVLNLVTQALETVTVPVLLGRSGVRVATPLAALGRQFDRVWVLGLADTLFPARTVDHPLIDSVIRARWAGGGVPVPDASTLASVEEALFLGAVAGAGMDLVVSRPRRDADGRELRPSRFWTRLGEARLAEKALPLGSESERHLAVALHGGALPDGLLAKVAVERDRDAGLPGAHAGQLQTPVAVSEWRWSPTQLHAAGACRYRWFAQKLLRLNEPSDPDQGEDRRVVGTLLHAALEGALQGEVPGGDPTADRVRRAEAALTRQERHLRATGALRPGPLWPVVREELRRTAVRAVQHPSFVPEGWTPLHLEARREFAVQAGPHTFSLMGVIDRVDQTPTGPTVTDYKTGSYVSKVVQGGALKLEIQLPLYMAATGAAGGRYLSIEQGRPLPEGAGPGAEGPRKKYRWPEHQAAVTTFLQDLGDALTRGDVAPSPDHKREACQYCAVKPVCRDRGPQGQPQPAVQL